MIKNYVDKLPDDAVKVKGALNWATPNGDIYGVDTRGANSSFKKHKHNYGECNRYFKYCKNVSNRSGYVYCLIKYVNEDGSTRCITRRAHIIIAETFLENPNNYPIVGHRNNIKTDNRVDNLYWTTWKENSQKAHDDGLIVNDKGYEDSQSMPIIMFDTYTNKEIRRFGSVCEATKETGISKQTITRQAKYKHPVRKPFYFRYQDDPSVEPPVIVIAYDISTHKEVGRYWNTQEASRQTDICDKTVSDQCRRNRIPSWSKYGIYFLYSNSQIVIDRQNSDKCVETIEN